jgi:hypothetical protein
VHVSLRGPPFRQQASGLQHSLLAMQLVKHASPSHLYPLQLVVVTSQTPVPLQWPAVVWELEVAPSVHVASEHRVVES